MPTASLAASVSPSPLPPLPAVTIVYSQSVDYPRLALTGAQVFVVDLSSMPAAGLRALRITHSTTDAAGVAVTAPIAIRFTINGSPEDLSMSPGGFFLHVDPSPTAGITGVRITTTANALLSIEAFG